MIVAFIGDGEIERKSPVAHVLLAYVGEQVRVLKEEDPQVRRGTLNSVHLMRIATRRLRSVLATYRMLLNVDTVNHLREELQWLGLILGAQRDAEVMSQRVKNMIAKEPYELTLAPASRWINEKLDADSHDAHLAVLKALNDKRYFRLHSDLEKFLASPPLTEVASQLAKKIIPNLIRKERKRLRRAVRISQNASANREILLHEVRKSAKRLRYAAETAILAHYKQAKKLVEAAEEIQTILGEHHDCAVCCDLLLRLGEQAKKGGEGNFNCVRLVTLEKRNAANSEIQFRKAWKHLPPGSLKG